MNELLMKYFDPNHDTPNYVLFNAIIQKKIEFKEEIDTEMRIPLLQWVRSNAHTVWPFQP